MTNSSGVPCAAPSRIDPRLLALAVTALGGAAVPLLALDPAPLWWVAIWALAAGLHAAAMLLFRARWVPALVVTAVLGRILAGELQSVMESQTALALGVSVGLLLTLFFAAPAVAARRARGAPAGDALDRALVPLSLWLGVLALLTMSLSGTSSWIDSGRNPLLLGDGRLRRIAALAALSVGASLAGATLFRDARRIRFLGAIDGDGGYDLIPWSDERSAGAQAVPYLSGALIPWAVVPRVREGPSVFRERGSSAVVAWLPYDLPRARRLLRWRAALSLVLLGVEAAGFAGIAVALGFHLSPLDGIAAVAPGWGYTCALRRSGDVVCWGWNDFGELGDGTRRHSYAPVRVHGVEDAVSLQPPCALLRSGEVRCWSSLVERPSEARPIEGLPPARLFAAGGTTVCVVTHEDNLVCMVERGPPRRIIDAPGAVTLIVTNSGVCVELRDSIQCLPYLLVRGVRSMRDMPAPCVRPSGAEPPLPDRLTSVYGTLYELTGEGRVYRWDAPAAGAVACEGPTILGGMEGIVRIDGGLALGADGSVRSWSPDEKVGSCTQGEMWMGSGAVDIRGYGDTSCAVRADGTVWCWGGSNDRGQIGDGTRRPRQFPTQVQR